MLMRTHASLVPAPCMQWGPCGKAVAALDVNDSLLLVHGELMGSSICCGTRFPKHYGDRKD